MARRRVWLSTRSRHDRWAPWRRFRDALSALCGGNGVGLVGASVSPAASFGGTAQLRRNAGKRSSSVRERLGVIAAGVHSAPRRRPRDGRPSAASLPRSPLRARGIDYAGQHYFTRSSDSAGGPATEQRQVDLARPESTAASAFGAAGELIDASRCAIRWRRHARPWVSLSYASSEPRRSRATLPIVPRGLAVASLMWSRECARPSARGPRGGGPVYGASFPSSATHVYGRSRADGDLGRRREGCSA